MKLFLIALCIVVQATYLIETRKIQSPSFHDREADLLENGAFPDPDENDDEENDDDDDEDERDPMSLQEWMRMKFPNANRVVITSSSRPAKKNFGNFGNFGGYGNNANSRNLWNSRNRGNSGNRGNNANRGNRGNNANRGNRGSPLTSVKQSQFSQVQDYCVKAHNKYRSKFGLPNINGDEVLRRFAQAKAKANLVNGMVHTKKATLKRLGYGENLASGSSSRQFQSVKTLVNDAVRMWYMEICYLQGNGDSCRLNAHNIGHMTAVLWTSSKKVGCGLQVDKKNGWNNYQVCASYKPPGNYAGRYESNLPCRKLLKMKRVLENNGECAAYKKKMSG